MKKMAFIYNPKAGKGKLEVHVIDLVKIFSKAGYEVTMIPTERKNHCFEFIAKEGARFDTVTVCGGDGTVNEAFNGLLAIDESKRPVLGYIPAGTTNDFAASCAIPTDTYEAAEIIVNGEGISIDAGIFNKSAFCYVAAFGAFTTVPYDTPQQVKNIFGYAAYLIEGIKQLPKVHSVNMKIATEKENYEGEFIFGMAANSHSVAGVKMKRLEVDLCDGLFEVILLKKINKPTDINNIVADLMAGKTDSDYYYVFKASELSIETKENMPWTLDGEFGGEHTNVEIKNVHKAIKIMVAQQE